jgi:hypothetical protein
MYRRIPGWKKRKFQELEPGLIKTKDERVAQKRRESIAIEREQRRRGFADFVDRPPRKPPRP